MGKKIYYGGQAVLEGVMMRGQKHMATAVRRPNGSIVVNTETLSSLYSGRWRKMPLARGVITLIESLVLGIKTMMYSANIAMEEEKEKVSGGTMWGTMLIGIVVAVALFFLAPLFITRQFNIESPIVFNLVEGVIRVGIFIAYLKVVGIMKDVRRTFEYHGAEHKAVNAHENGSPLEVEHVRRYSTAHVRCGTSFLFLVLIIAIIAFALVGKPTLWVMVLSRIILVPVIVAVSYEAIYFAGRHANNMFTRAILAPGLWLQSLSTRQPDDRQIEVAIAALKEVIAADEPQTVPSLTTPQVDSLPAS